MKTILRLAMLATGLALAASPALRAAVEAQPQPPPPAPGAPAPDAAQPNQPGWRGRRMDPGQRLQHLTEALGLSEDQQAKIKAIFKEEVEKRRAIMDDTSLSREDLRAKMMDLGQEMQARLRALLTPEQQQKFDAMPRPGRWMRGEGPGHGGPPPPAPPPPANGNPPPAPPANGNPPPPAGGNP